VRRRKQTTTCSLFFFSGFSFMCLSRACLGKSSQPGYEILEKKLTVLIEFLQAVAEMAAHVDVIYLHIDGDVMDETLVPAHRLAGDGPDLSVCMYVFLIAMRFVCLDFENPDHLPRQARVKQKSRARAVACCRIWRR
jgi:hypothetical protein